MTNPTHVLKGFGEVAGTYSGVILDQYGVLHNGVYALPGAVGCVKKLAAMNIRVMVLSNSTRRAEDTLGRLVAMGFPRDVFSGAVTSGEESYHYLKKTYNGKKCCFMDWKKQKTETPFTHGLNLTFVEPEEADFFLCYGSARIVTGSDKALDVLETTYYDDGDIASLEPFLQRVIRAGIPTVCCNPDVTVISQKEGQATLKYPPGGISNYLKANGASVLDFGKPNTEHFEACLRKMGLEKAPEKACHCGDSLTHDIKGANDAGVHSLFVAGGIHAKELNVELQNASDIRPKAYEELFAKHGDVVPTYSIPMFTW